MPEKKQGQVILMSEQQMKTMPILAMRDVCVLPGMLVHLDVSREITKRAIEEAMAEDGSIFLTLQRDESIETPSFHDLYEIGVIAKIKQEVKVKDDVLRVMISTKERGNLLSLNQTKPFLKGEVVPYEWGDEELRPGALEKEAMCRNLKDVYTIYLNENPRASRSDLEKIQGMKDLGKLTDLIAMHINMGFDKRQEILECLDLELRYEMVAGILTNEVNLSRIREGYRRKVKEEVDKNQKEYFLREQMKVIRNELGDGASAEEYQEKYKEQLEQLSCSEEVYQKIAEEIIEKVLEGYEKGVLTRREMKMITNIFEYCSKNVPLWNTISISGYHIREAGSTAAQEIAFTIADGIAYIEAALKAGMKIDDFAGRLSFFWNAHNNVLEEVAKFRASRRLWATILKERFHAQNPKSMKLRFHTQTAGSMLTAQQPNNNIVRVALQTAAAVMGGTQSLHTNSRDEALALPTTESVTIALRTQQIVAYESGLADVVDPLGGSYYVEAMTNAIEAEAKEYIRKIDEMGGAVEAIDKGYIQKEIQDSAYAWQMAVESGERTIVGVNKFTMEEAPVEGLLKVDASAGEFQKNKLAKVKAERDNAKVKEELAKLEVAAADESVNLMPVILDCVRAYCSLGEICGVLRKVFGEYKAHNTL